MRNFVCISFVYFIVTAYTMATDLEGIRQVFPMAVNDKSSCRRMIDELEHSKQESYVHLAYLGAFQTIWAEHTWSPIQKLSTFNRGKEHIEEAVKADPNNVEIRFVRYTIQSKAPKFLGYNEHLAKDKSFLEANKESIKSPALKKMVKDVLGT